jgi:hypothetical protein
VVGRKGGNSCTPSKDLKKLLKIQKTKKYETTLDFLTTPCTPSKDLKMVVYL